MRRNTKFVITRYLFALLLTVTALAACTTDGVKPENLNETVPFEVLARNSIEVGLQGLQASILKSGDNGFPPKHITLAFTPVSAAIEGLVMAHQSPRHSGKPEQCALVAVQVETDNRSETHEWLITQGKSCQLLSYGDRLFWIVQRQEGAVPVILLADKGSSLEIVGKERNTRLISVQREGKTCPTCQTTKCTWSWMLDPYGKYSPGKNYLVERFKLEPGYAMWEPSTMETACPLN